MHEEQKLKEAEYHYTRMVKEIDNGEHFLFELSAFLSAARSVMQYACKEIESSSKTGGKQWYDRHMSSSVLKFFKDKRDFNVHHEPIHANQHTTVKLEERLHLSESINVYKVDRSNSNRTTIVYSSEQDSQDKSAPDGSIDISIRFTFTDWPGNEDVLQLCEQYLKKLQYVVEDGQNKGFLT